MSPGNRVVEMIVDAYRSMPRRRTLAEKRAIRRRRVARLGAAHARSWGLYTAFFCSIALIGSFVLGAMSTAPDRDEIARQERYVEEWQLRVQLYESLLHSSHSSFMGILSILHRCQDREARESLDSYK